MDITFISNYFNHHQKRISDKLFELTEGKYKFVATSVMREERKRLGYGGWEIPDYVIDICKDSYREPEVKERIEKSSVIIWGSCSLKIFISHLRKRKLTFMYSERLFKQTENKYHNFLRKVKYALKLNRYKDNHYLLCASAYAYADYYQCGLFHQCAFKWGYFPEFKFYDDVDSIILQKNKTQILWCGRLIGWKHPEVIIEVAKRLKEDHIDFNMIVMGTGELENELFAMIQKENLEKEISMIGSVPFSEVRMYMEKSGVFLATSDYQEGWGAVVNEAMNSACAVVASHAMGSVPFLISDKNNGYIYTYGNNNELYEKVKYLLIDKVEQERIGKAAYRTIKEEWNANIAAERLTSMINSMLSGEKIPIYKSGPCSKAEILSDEWYKNE